MRFMRCINWWHLGKTSLLVGFLFFFCEVLIYYVVLLQCTWPQIQTNTKHSTVKAMLLADVHLLGPRFGHWFDKLRREWQMYRTFQTAMTLHNPQVVFILGDIFDEGHQCNEMQFNNYVKRFHSVFSVPEDTKLHVVIGNHDIGFHYGISPQLKDRFEKSFNTSSVELLTINNNIFVLVNSMALHGDNCFLCKPAEDKLKDISEMLRCAKNGGVGNIVKSTNLLRISPGSIFLQENIEWTLPSFSWRNKNDPSFVLAVFAPDTFLVSKCYMPKESTVIHLYMIGGFLILMWIYFSRYRYFKGTFYKEK
ncbi:Metallophosphoesterase 1 [Araneus ventricosus]|uniref:Metallophosphoesterase 1 n=1 Tax=Araneus ventricosus TaxID=182803 RepID=A0A4Y2D0X2_ARAVE|nr:Metallophosphoesterase 1 [Araneus ventricosus]